VYKCDVQDIPCQGLNVSEYSMEEYAVKNGSGSAKSGDTGAYHSTPQSRAFDLLCLG